MAEATIEPVLVEPIYRAHAMVCGGTGCVASESIRVRERLEEEVQRNGLANEVKVIQTGCRGFCAEGPIMIIYPDGIFYTQVQPDDVPVIVEETLLKGRIVKRLLHKEPAATEALPYYQDIPFYEKQIRVVLRNCGMINPELIDEYIARDGYAALSKVLNEMTPEQVIEEIKASGLRGRGGAGFSTGQKWQFCRAAKGDLKYLICNADEGDPGAFMDRSVLEGDPHTVLEGMLIAAYAIGASHGYIYCRAEYPLAIHRLKIAIAQAEEYGLLGDHILETDFHFHVKIKEGAGAFVCGEETALMASIEGERGMPRPRPPFPANKGLWGKPTNINNVETFANIAPIIIKGASWFAGMGTEKSKGTKVFALTGKINNTGLIEVPMGVTMKEIIFEIGGGIPNKKQFKAAQMGGPSGGCVPAAIADTPIDYESLVQAGAIMGSGGVVVMDNTTCMVDVARYFLAFTQSESCGKCVPCRVGTKVLLETLTRITKGEGQEGDIELLQDLANQIKATSLS
ncbi:MAG: NAD(P)H-dependent oxidoreductase subunit E, partial [Chloroflexi bacterium]|nr:NAD(P)H-dependent oxidoreductase subunit E [Chloroflexota bacterium]